MKNVLTLLTILVIPIVSFSQTTWRNGSITKKDGTVLNGQINDLEWNSAFTEIEFRQDQQSPERFSVNDILGFSTDRPALYQSHEVTYDNESQSLKALPLGKEAQHLVTERLFLEVLVNAEITLLYMTAKNSRRHFFIKQGSDVTELLYRMYQHPDDNASFLTNPKFKQQLILITNDCYPLQKTLMNIEYSHSALINVFRKMNECKGYTLSPIWEGPERVHKKPSFGFVVMGFYASAKYLNYFNSKATTANAGAGLFVEFYSKKKPNRISFYNELMYKKVFPQKGVYNREPSLALPSNEGEMECQKIRLLNAVRFSYPGKKRGRSYFGVGISNGIRNNTLIGGESTALWTNEDFSSDYEVGFNASVGKTFALTESLKFNTEVRYEYEYGVKQSYTFDNFGLSVQLCFN